MSATENDEELRHLLSSDDSDDRKGIELGTVFAMSISGVLCKHGFDGGWPSVFYLFGALGCVWYVLWMVLIYDTPAQHPRISMSERNHILRSIGDVRRDRVPTPWREILKSTAVWAIVAAHFTNNWGYYTMLTCLPTYMKKILRFDIQQNGALSASAYLLLWFFQVMSGFVADFIRRRNYLSTANTRKLLNTTGFLIPACFLIGACYTGCDHYLAAALLILGVSGSGFSLSGVFSNHLDIAPRFAGTLLGISNTVATIPGFLGPHIVAVLSSHTKTTQWRIFFFITGGIYLMGILLFNTFGQGVEQPWANGPPAKTAALAQEPVNPVQDDDNSTDNPTSLASS